MCLLISILMMFYFYIEITLFAKVASAIGGILVFYEVILSAVLGNYFLSQFNQNPPQTEHQLKTMPIRLLGAFLFMLPGMLTDFIGLLCLLPGINLLLVWLIGQYAKSMIDNGRMKTFVYRSYSSTNANQSDEFEQMRLQSDYQNARDANLSDDSSESSNQSNATNSNQSNSTNSNQAPKIIRVKGKKIE